MTTFRVWAPRAEQVDVEVLQRRVPMRLEDGGWWAAEVPEAVAGVDYAFRLDRGEATPDPRSPWQPAGVHGPSRVVDHAAFPWTDQHWRGIDLADAVVYELHVGTFTPEGTFDAVVPHLDYLTDLGVTVLELLPVAEFSGDHGWGYDGVDLYAPHHAFGGPDGLKRLVDACHRRGLGVVLDVVYNHLGPAGNYLARFGPYFTSKYATPWGDAINYDDAGSDEVRAFVVDNAVMWLRDYHCDGLRLDAVHAIYDQSAIHLLEELQARVSATSAETGRSLFLIAESDLNDPRLVTEQSRGGYGLAGQWSDDFHHALHTALTGERDGYYADYGALADVATALQDVFVYAGRHSTYRGRRHGRPVPAEVPATRFLGYVQNHDQVGNRATGERLIRLTRDDGLLRIAAALVLLSPFVPLLFMGEEWGATTPFRYFTDHRDPELADAVRKGRREEFAAFGWDPEEVPDPQDPQSFLLSKLDWVERDRPRHAPLLTWHRDLIWLRRQTPDLRDGDRTKVEVTVDEEQRTLVLRRGSITIATNFSAQLRDVPLPVKCHPDPLLASDRGVDCTIGAVWLPPASVAVLRPWEGWGS